MVGISKFQNTLQITEFMGMVGIRCPEIKPASKIVKFHAHKPEEKYPPNH